MKRICFLVDSIFSFGGVQRVTSVIAKELARDYNVTIVTFDPPQTKDTSMYRLEEADLKYRFFAYPRISRLKQNCCRLYSAVYRKLRLQSRWASDLYALSSFPSELRNALAEELRQGKYDVIVGVHAPLAARLATLRRQLPGVRLLGWSHNSFEALFGKSSLYIGPEIKRHYVYQFRKLDKVVLLCQHDVTTYRQYDPAFTPLYIYNPLTLTPGQCSDGSSRRFLAVGRFSHQHKGFDLLIKAFSLFAAEDSEWQLGRATLPDTHQDITPGGPGSYTPIHQRHTSLLLPGSGLRAQFALGRLRAGTGRGHVTRTAGRLVKPAYKP